MNKFILQSVLVLACLVNTSLSAAREYVVALSPYQDADSLQSQISQALQFAVSLEPGDTVSFMDGYQPARLGRFIIPDNTAYAGAKARLAMNREALREFKTFIANVRSPGGVDAPVVHSAVRLPQLLRHISQNVPAGQDVDVLVLGSLLYDDPRQPGFSMAQGREVVIPGDGHLSNSRSKSPYGAVDTPSLLKGVRLHLVYPDRLPSDRHAYFLRRFWSLWVEALGGTLVSFSRDMSATLERISARVPAPAQRFTRDESDKLEMIYLREVKLQQSLYTRPLSQEALSPEMFRRAENVLVGISWQCAACDLDLMAKPLPDAGVLSFRNTRTPEGHYWKDYRSGKELANGRETISFSTPIDLRALRIAVNFYGGGTSEGGVSGELRLAVADKTYAQAFHIPAGRGNGGKDVGAVMEGRTPVGPHTVVIDPLAVVGATSTRF